MTRLYSIGLKSTAVTVDNLISVHKGASISDMDESSATRIGTFTSVTDCLLSLVTVVQNLLNRPTAFNRLQDFLNFKLIFLLLSYTKQYLYAANFFPNPSTHASVYNPPYRPLLRRSVLSYRPVSFVESSYYWFRHLLRIIGLLWPQFTTRAWPRMHACSSQMPDRPPDHRQRSFVVRIINRSSTIGDGTNNVRMRWWDLIAMPRLCTICTTHQGRKGKTDLIASGA